MFKKNLLIQTCVLALIAPLTAFAAKGEMCIGNLFEESAELPDITPPTVKIIRDMYAPRLGAGQSVVLSAQTTTDGGSPMLFWCIKGEDEIGNLEAVTPDFSQIKYTAPNTINTEQVLRLIARVGDNQGYANGDNIYVHLLAGMNGGASHIIVGTTENKLLVYSTAGELQTTINPTQGDITQIATLDADNDQSDEIAVKGLSGVYELNGELNSNITTQSDFIIRADVDGDGDLETIMGSQTTHQVTVDGTAFSVFSNARRGTRDGKRDDDDDKGKNTKITICHKGRETKIIPISAWGGHKGHGDTEGACSPIPPKKDDDDNDDDDDDDNDKNVNGVNVAAGDLDGDGKAEIVAAMAKNGSTVEIYHSDGSLISSFQAFETANGVIVTTGDVNNDGMADIIAGDAGGTEVRVFTLTGGQATQLLSFNVLDTGMIASLAFAKQLANQPVTPTLPGTPITTETPTTTPDIVTPPVPLVVYAPQCQTATDGIHLSCAGNGMLLTGNMMIESYLSVSDVKIAGHIINYGWLGNITVFLGGIITGGTLTGDVENQGLIIDIQFRGHKLKGGKLKNRIKILADVSLRLGIVEDVTLEEGTHLSGGRLQGKIQGSPNNPALLEDTEIAEGTYLSYVIIGRGVKFLGRGAHEENVQRQDQ